MVCYLNIYLKLEGSWDEPLLVGGTSQKGNT